ncbi:MAG: energy-coupling factor ABC transporter substrate-binding protein [Rhodospirillaceae bacterium]|nr:energy-coupling factor ABC transporter substrate-binding protein [Rhodospirillales bacterium]
MSRAQNAMLLLMAVAVVAAPMILGLPGEYGGTDSAAQAVIAEGGYQPWFKSLWTPPSKEIESLLFALQAAAGAGVLGYVLGRIHGRRQR